MTATTMPRPYGRQPTRLRPLAKSISYQLERELRAAGLDYAVFVKAFWLRGGDGDDYGWADYQHAYIWIAPVVMSLKLCEQIEQLVKPMRGVIQTGCGGGPSGNPNPLRPFVYAVVDVRARS